MSYDGLASDCRIASAALRDNDIFPTGQGILLDAADRIDFLESRVKFLEEIENQRVTRATEIFNQLYP